MSGEVGEQVRQRLGVAVLEDPAVVSDPSDRAAVRRCVARELARQGVVAPPHRWAAMVRELVDDLVGLGPVEALLRDPAVTDVCCNGPEEVWVERDGRLERADGGLGDDEQARRRLDRVLAPLGARLDPARPWVDAVLPGGVRLHALLPPLVDHVTVTLRRVPASIPTWDDLVGSGSVAPDAAAHLRSLVRERANLVVCGPTGSGKTTLLARLLSEVVDERVVIVQDAPELARPARHTVHLHVRPDTPDGRGGVDTRTLVRNALRMRPDRIVVGEVRGDEVVDLLLAMNTGHHGSATTVHANGAVDALVRLEGMALAAGVPAAAVRPQLGTAVDVVVATDRGHDGRRRVSEILRVAPDGGPGDAVWP